MTKYDLYCNFDIEQHKTHYINYLEVVIDLDGKIHYAVPSHQEYLIKVLCDKLGKSRKEIGDMCPPEYYFDFLYWLTKMTGYCSIHNDYLVYDTLNDKQLITLKTLKDSGLFRDKFHNVYFSKDGK